MLATTQTHQSLSTRFDELEVELQVHRTSSHACFFQSMVSRFVQKGSDKHFCTLQTHVEEKKMLEQPEPEATKSFMHRGSNASSSKDQYKSSHFVGYHPRSGRRKQADQASKICLGLFHDWPFFRPWLTVHAFFQDAEEPRNSDNAFGQMAWGRFFGDLEPGRSWFWIVVPAAACRVMFTVRLTMLSGEQNASMIESINNLMNKMFLRAGLVDIKMITDENTDLESNNSNQYLSFYEAMKLVCLKLFWNVTCNNLRNTCSIFLD